MRETKKIVKDFQAYLDYMVTESTGISKKQRADLNNILRVMLTALVALKNHSNLGKRSIRFIGPNDQAIVRNVEK